MAFFKKLAPPHTEKKEDAILCIIILFYFSQNRAEDLLTPNLLIWDQKTQNLLSDSKSEEEKIKKTRNKHILLLKNRFAS